MNLDSCVALFLEEISQNLRDFSIGMFVTNEERGEERGRGHRLLSTSFDVRQGWAGQPYHFRLTCENLQLFHVVFKGN